MEIESFRNIIFDSFICLIYCIEYCCEPKMKSQQGGGPGDYMTGALEEKLKKMKVSISYLRFVTHHFKM
jgi:hypothetical protein